MQSKLAKVEAEIEAALQLLNETWKTLEFKISPLVSKQGGS